MRHKQFLLHRPRITLFSARAAYERSIYVFNNVCALRECKSSSKDVIRVGKAILKALL